MSTPQQRDIVQDLRAMLAEHERQLPTRRDPNTPTEEIVRPIMEAVPGGTWRN